MATSIRSMDEFKQDAVQLAQEVRNLELRIKEIPHETINLREEGVKLKKQLGDNDKKVNDLQRELRDAKGHLGEKRRELEKVNEGMKNLERDIRAAGEKTANDNTQTKKTGTGFW